MYNFTKNGFSGICQIKILGILNRSIVDRKVYTHKDETRKARIEYVSRNTSIALD
ncbi:hypothetical protein [Microcoleus sp. herbarium14]|uniref:hypothetical protein n=1 Tax=Microcoleus sp. herbarium14 TaxID=3055439 RepID=UPI002FD361B8